MKLISIGNFDLKLNHLLIIGILSLCFSISFLIRSQPANFGWELNEFDPFFNFRATQFLVENGIDAYFQWNDELSWYPIGRDVSSNSQVILHLITASSYTIFGGGDLYGFTILFPAVIGSLTCIVIFALVRVIGGTTAGLLSALFFSVSFPIIVRGQIGWFKSEPLGLFLSIFSIYLFLSAINSKNQKISVLKLITSGIILSLSLSAWGGNQFFIISLGIFFLSLPFLRTDHKFLAWTIPIFTISTIITSLIFERPGISFVTGIGGLSLIIPTLFLISCISIQNKSNKNSKNKNGLLFLLAIILIASIFLILNNDYEFMSLPSYRYLNAINPFLTTTDPLIDSVAEHATTTIQQSFLFHSVLMIFAGIGIWLILNSKKINFIKKDMISFSLIIGFFGIYISSAFIRMEVFASISIIILSSLGISILIKEFFSNKLSIKKSSNFLIRTIFIVGVFILIIIPLTISENSIFTLTNNPPTILNGGTNWSLSSNDWVDSLEWIKNNSRQDAVIASWWDYGYWIQTKSERATLVDNSTVHTGYIRDIAKIFLSSPDTSKKLLDQKGADHFVIFISGQRLQVNGADNQPIYILGGGGDESKKQWFIKIADEPLGKYLHSDGMSGTEYFWNETLMGKLIPFELLGYVNFQTNEQSLTYQPGFTGVYEKVIKYPKNENGPFKLVYASPSFNAAEGEPVLGVFVYEINKNYVPLN